MIFELYTTILTICDFFRDHRPNPDSNLHSGFATTFFVLSLLSLNIHVYYKLYLLSFQIEFIHYKFYLQSLFMAAPNPPVCPFFCSHQSPTDNFHVGWESHTVIFFPFLFRQITNPLLDHRDLIETEDIIDENDDLPLFFQF